MTSKFLTILADESMSVKLPKDAPDEAVQEWLKTQPENPEIKYRSYDRKPKGDHTLHIYRGWKENPFPDGGFQPIERYRPKK